MPKKTTSAQSLPVSVERPTKPSGNPVSARAAKSASRGTNGNPAILSAPDAKPAGTRRSAGKQPATAAHAAASTTQPSPNHKPSDRRNSGLTLEHEQIALRAYFISERRRAEGRCGDPSEDWAAAERELMAEAKKSGRQARA